MLSFSQKQALKALPGVLPVWYAMAHRYNFTRLVTDRTQLCVEGFPRSGNSFAFQCVTRGLGMPVPDLGHHTHSIANVRRAIARKIPTFVMIRRPRACCSSLVVLGVANALPDAYRAYRDYHEAMLPLLPHVTLVPFESFVAQPEALANAVARCLNMPEIDRDHLDRLREYLEGDDAARLRAGKGGSGSARYPNAEKDRLKDAVLRASASPAVEALAVACDALHDRVLAAAPQRIGDLR